MNDTQEKILVNATQAAKLLSVSRSKFYDMVRHKQVPQPRKIGKCSRWSVAALRKVFEEVDAPA